MTPALQLPVESAAVTFDLGTQKLRDLNAALARLAQNTNQRAWHVQNPRGAHAIAVGVTLPIAISIDGHVGYYCAGMNDGAGDYNSRQCRARCRGKHDVRHGACDGRCQPRPPVRRRMAGC